MIIWINEKKELSFELHIKNKDDVVKTKVKDKKVKLDNSKVIVHNYKKDKKVFLYKKKLKPLF